MSCSSRRTKTARVVAGIGISAKVSPEAPGDDGVEKFTHLREVSGPSSAGDGMSPLRTPGPPTKRER